MAARSQLRPFCVHDSRDRNDQLFAFPFPPEMRYQSVRLEK